jgi:hypothetical protein
VDRAANVFAVHIGPEVALLGLSRGQIPVIIVVTACLVAIVVAIGPHVSVDELRKGREREEGVDRWIDICVSGIYVYVYVYVHVYVYGEIERETNR